MSDLAQRLRLNATIPLVMEAADRIEALEADIAASEHNFRTMRRLRNKAVARIEALEAVLREIIAYMEADEIPHLGIMADRARAAFTPEQDK